MCQEQYDVEIMQELYQQQINAKDMLNFFGYMYNTNVGTKGESSVTTSIFSRRSSSKDQQID